MGCIDQKTLPKTAGTDTIVKLCDDRGLRNGIPGGEKSSKVL